jgi:hypothetical protein
VSTVLGRLVVRSTQAQRPDALVGFKLGHELVECLRSLVDRQTQPAARWEEA